MSHQYQKQFSIPDSFPQVLKEFTREILRNQPKNIYEFGYQYFKEKAEELKKKSSPSSQSSKDIVIDSEKLIEGFAAADTSKTGQLYFKELKSILKNTIQNASELQILCALSFADIDDKGMVDYKSFGKQCAEMLTSLIATNSFVQVTKQMKMITNESELYCRRK
jgi:hypothetical protein